MSPDDLLRHFERIADAPGAIERFRRFVLDLAVRGKIVEQVQADEPASELLHRIRSEKKRLIANGLIRAQKPVPRPQTAPFEIPDRWQWTQLAEIGLVSPKNEAPDNTSASFVPMTLVAAEYGIAHGHEIRPWGEIKKGYTHFANGDVGLAKITPCFENGKSTVFRGLNNGIGSGTTELHVVRPLLISPDFVVLFLKSPHFIETGIPKMTGTAGQKRVPVEYFANAPFPLPPLPEQHRIVAKVNELMELCDRLEAARAERETARDRLTVASLASLNAPDPETFAEDAHLALRILPALTARPDQVKQIRQAVLNLAVQGRLVEQDPNDERASSILAQIAEDRSRTSQVGRAKRLTSMPPPDIDQAPFALPTGWAWARFPELGQFGRGKSKHRPRNDPALFEGGTHLLIQTGDVARSKGVIRTFTGKYNDAGLAQSLKWPQGTLCITIAANIADSGILSFDACFPDSVVGFVPAAVFENARYFEYFLRTAKANLLEFAPATAQKNINLEILESVLIPLPPLNEQRRIVARVDELMSLCDQLEGSLQASERHQSQLLDALLHDALELTEAIGEAL